MAMAFLNSKVNSQAKSIVTILCFLALTACDAALDCLDNDGPVFDKEMLLPAVLNQVYTETIRASVQNEPQDQRFEYRFIVTGQLPEGITHESFGQSLVLNGTAVDAGDFPFTLYVEVDDGLDAQQSGLCFVSTSRNYVLMVSET